MNRPVVECGADRTAGALFTYSHDRVRSETSFHQNPRALPGLSADLTLAYVTPK